MVFTTGPRRREAARPMNIRNSNPEHHDAETVRIAPEIAKTARLNPGHNATPTRRRSVKHIDSRFAVGQVSLPRHEPVLSMRNNCGHKLRTLLLKSMAVAIALCGRHLLARSPVVEAGSEIAVSVDGHGLIPEHLIWEAQASASEIFKPLGLHIRWTGEKPAAPGSARVINVSFVPIAPPAVSAGALASTCLQTGSVHVFYDRVLPVIQGWPRFAPALLSYVLAHEIAHVLQARNRHSDTGILKAHWSQDDFFLMLSHRLAFTPVDVALIREGLAAGARTPSATE
jgi:hypothetical protein